MSEELSSAGGGGELFEGSLIMLVSSAIKLLTLLAFDISVGLYNGSWNCLGLSFLSILNIDDDFQVCGSCVLIVDSYCRLNLFFQMMGSLNILYFPSNFHLTLNLILGVEILTSIHFLYLY